MGRLSLFGVCLPDFDDLSERERVVGGIRQSAMGGTLREPFFIVSFLAGNGFHGQGSDASVSDECLS
jgi:hypothetical protein